MATVLEPMFEEDEDLMETVLSSIGLENITDRKSSAGSSDNVGDVAAADSETPNMFDGLCSSLMTSLQMVQAALDELMCLKDELLKHALPPILLSNVVLCTSKVFRSISECRVPAGELLRMVHVYSESWQNKSSVFQKLHDNYSSVKLQLDIALRKLAINDAKVKRAEKQKRLMNWEKLYLRTVLAETIGEKYEETMGQLRHKSQEGVESLKDHVLRINKVRDRRLSSVAGSRRRRQSSLRPRGDTTPGTPTTPGTRNAPGPFTPGGTQTPRSETEVLLTPETGVNADEIVTDAQRLSVIQDSTEDNPMVDTVESQQETVNEDVFVLDDEILSVTTSDSDQLSVDERVEQTPQKTPVSVRPELHDIQVSTNDDDYNVYLYVRVHPPDGLGDKPVQCTVAFADQRYKTPIIHASVQSIVVKPTAAETRVKRFGRGLIGSRQTAADKQQEAALASQAENINLPRFADIVFKLSDELVMGVATSAVGSQLNVRINDSASYQLLGTTTIDMEDLNNSDLSSFPLPSLDNATIPCSDTLDSTVDMELLSGLLRSQLETLRPLCFPVYPPESSPRLDGVTDDIEHPLGGDTSLKLTCCWGKQLRPKTFDRNTQAESVCELVFSMTGIELESNAESLVTRPVTVDRSSSPFNITDQIDNELISRAEYMKVLYNHKEEIALIKEEYESRFNDLTEAVQMMHESQVSAPIRRLSRDRMQKTPRPGSPKHSRSPPRSRSYLDPITEPANRDNQNRNVEPRFYDGRDPPTTWGEDIPRNFFDRLQHFQARVKQRRRELCERNREQTSDNIERCLATEYKLSSAHLAGHDGIDQTALQDVSLPAVFMPTKVRDLNIYNPRAHQYFHPTGSSRLRLTQPPSIMQLPPIPKSSLSVVNLFEISRNFKRVGSTDDWLVHQYVPQQDTDQSQHPEQPPESQLEQPLHRLDLHSAPGLGRHSSCSEQHSSGGQLTNRSAIATKN